MSVCTYDNPNTIARECWENGKIICSYSMYLLASKTKIKFFFGANTGPWKTGQIIGDSDAMLLPQIRP